MIDWTNVDKNDPAAWVQLSESLLQRAIAAIQANDKAAMKGIQDDLLEAVQAATLACPVRVLTGINSTSRQVATALLALDIDKLKERSAALDAAGAKVSVAAATMRAEAARLRLEEVSKVLGELTSIVADARAMRDQINAIPKKDVPAKLDAVLESLQKFDSRIRQILA